MRLIKRSTLRDYAQAHPVTAASLRHWEQLIKAAEWTSMDDVRKAFSKAKVLNGERARFEIGGGRRLIVAFAFPSRVAYVKFLGTHAEYDRIDALSVDAFGKET